MDDVVFRTRCDVDEFAAVVLSQPHDGQRHGVVRRLRHFGIRGRVLIERFARDVVAQCPLLELGDTVQNVLAYFRRTAADCGAIVAPEMT